MKTDVLIVGGGLAGLSLADKLTQSETDFMLVEAQERLGGRILSEDLSGAAFDLGPAWFWPGQPRMAGLAQRIGLNVFEQYASGDVVFQDAMGVVQRGRGFASMQGSYRIDGGMGRFISGLSNAIDSARVLTSTRLMSLSLQDGQVLARLSQFGTDLSVEANEVVLALPPRVAAESVAFTPSLGISQMAALERIPTWMAGQAKIVAIYDEPYWRNAGLSGDGMSQRGPMVEIHDASPAAGGPFALFGFLGIPADVRLAKKDQLLDLARTQLGEMFGPDAARPKDIVLKDWADAPEISTSLDRAPAGGHPRYGLPGELKELWDARLHFASTESAPEFGGFLEGALEAAEITARKLAVRVSNAA